MEKPLISMVIPAFNEEKNIGSVLEGLHNVLMKMEFPHEIIVVNDGSIDQTAKIAKRHNVVLIDNGTNQGKGAALRAGFIRARGQFIITMDADGSHQPEDIPKLVSPIINSDDLEVVVGSRFTNNSGKNSTTNLHLLGNRIINSVILFLTGRYVSDSQSGFRVFKRDALRKLSMNSSRYEIESELTVKVLKKGFRIREVPVNCIERKSGCTKINSFRDGFNILKAILRATFCG